MDDTLIREALEERAAEVTVPADAWARQKRLLQAPARRPWWRRWGAVLEVAAVAGLMLGLVAVGVARGPYHTGNGGGEKAPPVADDLNPVAQPPTPHVVVAPDLPALTPPAGSLPQDRIIAAGVAMADKAIHGGQLTLTGIALVDGRWELTFRGDGRAISSSHGPRPADPRKGAYSHVSTVDQLTYQIDGATGEIYSTGINGGAMATHRTDLEHYRGFIVSGGEQTTLRLVRADGSREGRDLTVWAPGQALSAGGLALWHLNYGTGRQLDVWGLTIAPGEVLAYRVDMKDRPEEALLDHDVIHGIPIPDGARPTRGIYGSAAGYIVPGETVAGLKAWYAAQMPRYGWQSAKLPAAGPAGVLNFVIDGWQYASIAILPDEQGAQFTLSWGMTRLGNQDQAVAAVFRDLGDDPAFSQFPRTTGKAQGELNIGGPLPGTTIPATYETRVSKYPDGAWQVELIRSWGDGPHTTWAFRVEEEGIVHRLGQSGDEPPHVP